MSRKIIVNFSGGKDSTVALLEALKVYPKNDIQIVFEDTGAEYKYTKEHVLGIADMLDVPLTILSYHRNWYEQVEFDKMPFTPALRKCTHRLKLDVYHSWLSKFRKDNELSFDDIITVTGIRGEESKSRSKLSEVEFDPHTGWHWRPCLYMRANEVKERVKAEGLPLHYCYEFSSRCNCWLCIFAGKYEIQAYIERNPDDWEKACLLEDKIGKPLLSPTLAINDIMKQGRLL